MSITCTIKLTGRRPGSRRPFKRDDGSVLRLDNVCIHDLTPAEIRRLDAEPWARVIPTAAIPAEPTTQVPPPPAPAPAREDSQRVVDEPDDSDDGDDDTKPAKKRRRKSAKG